ncbi:MAG: aspartyl protease family protein [Candidatus Sumerlaeota bacterium]|nr:aspartyl protease family protein [Candidatus Sumerlaeota bacterium]
MGLTYIHATLTAHKKNQQKVKFLVDSGVPYSLLPYDLWQELKLKPKRTASFTLADGTTIKRKISECHFDLAGEEGYSPVILGEKGDDIALLGVITLETLGLVLDPFQRKLRPMQMI